MKGEITVLLKLMAKLTLALGKHISEASGDSSPQHLKTT